MRLPFNLKYVLLLGAWIFVVFYQLPRAEASRGFKFTSLNCETFNKTIATFNKCRIHFKSRQTVISVNVSINSLVDNCIVRVKIMQKKNGWRPFFYDRKTDICEFLANPRKFYLPYLVFLYARPYHNIRHKCPYDVGEVLLGTDIEARGEEILAMFPLDIGEYGMFSTWFVNGKLVASINGSMTYTDYSKG